MYGCSKWLQNRIKHIVSMQYLSNKKIKKARFVNNKNKSRSSIY